MNPADLRKRNWRLRLNKSRKKAKAGNEAEMVADFIRKHGVERCPPAHAENALHWSPPDRVG